MFFRTHRVTFSIDFPSLIGLYDNILYFDGEKNNLYVEVAFQHNDSYNESVLSFVNNINTPDGGTH